MRAQTWTLTSLATVSRHRVFDVRRGTYERADGFTKTMFTLGCPDWVNVLAVTEKAEIVLVRQYRPGPDVFTWEMPGGVMDPGEDALGAARRELVEETGYDASSFEPLGSAFPNPAIQGNRIHYVLAIGAREVGPPAFDGEGEECERILVPVADLDRLLENEAFSHALCWASLAKARPRLQALVGPSR